MAQLEQEGFVDVEVGLLADKEAIAFYTLVADEESIRSNFFRPQQKISHHVGLPPYSM